MNKIDTVFIITQTQTEFTFFLKQDVYAQTITI